MPLDLNSLKTWFCIRGSVVLILKDLGESSVIPDKQGNEAARLLDPWVSWTLILANKSYRLLAVVPSITA